MQVCQQRYEVSTAGRQFPSSSSDKVYKVTAYVPNQFDFCGCPAYIFQRSKKAKAEGIHQNDIPGTCKHLEAVLRDTCDWIQERADQYRFDDTCPKCNGPLVDPELPTVPDIDDPAATDDMRALLAELRGEEAPPPLPKPKPWVIEYDYTTQRRVVVEAITEEEANEKFDVLVSQNSGADTLGEQYECGVIGGVKVYEQPPEAEKPKKRATRARKAAKKAGPRQKPTDTSQAVKQLMEEAG